MSAWRGVIVPALQRDDLRVAVWPFHGDLESLLADSDVVLAETCPVEAYRHVDLPAGGLEQATARGPQESSPIALGLG